jgi:hypothetical protein
MNLMRKVCWLVLLGGLSWIFILTTSYFGPQPNEAIMVRFANSGAYLPPGQSFTREQIWSPVSRILTDDRQEYRQICFVSLLSGIAAMGIAIIPQRKS